MAEAFYRGLAYPFQKSDQAFPAPAYDDALVKQSLEQLLLTTPTERVMRGEFGCNLHKFVFENNDDLLPQLMQLEIAAAIGRWEPRASFIGLDFQRNETTLIVQVNYVVVATGTLDDVTIGIPTQGA
jgi:phage baseplate assembly protein W